MSHNCPSDARVVGFSPLSSVSGTDKPIDPAKLFHYVPENVDVSGFSGLPRCIYFDREDREATCKMYVFRAKKV